MAEPLKNLYNEELIHSLCSALSSHYKKFNSGQFTERIFDKEWDQRELKDRMRHISVTLHSFLPPDYETAIEILIPASADFSGFEYMFFPDYVELYGLDEFEVSMSALEYFTEFSSSEFAVRPFIIKYPARMMRQMEEWAGSGNYHVRRLASEGCRPRLPWAMALPEFKKNPKAILDILDILKSDESEYVRRSVANNLNDISKDNPGAVIEIANSWLGDNPDTDWLVKHACRTLLKNAEPKIMALFGLGQPRHVELKTFKVLQRVKMGGNLSFSFLLKTQTSELGKLRIEYAIDFMKHNGKQSRKIFKISEAEYPAQEKQISRNHSFRSITTRKYYPGSHGIAIIVNGYELVNSQFQLTEAG